MSNATIDPKAIVRAVLDPELKFVDEDVTSDLHRAGLTYLADYTGNFAYLCDLKTRKADNLSTGQVRGILNCIRAEVLREGQAKLAGEALAVGNGRYAITIGDKLRFFHVNAPTKGNWVGFTFVKEFISASIFVF